MFYLKYFVIFIIIMELMMSYTIISSAYIGYKQKRVKLKTISLLSIASSVVIFSTLAITIYTLW